MPMKKTFIFDLDGTLIDSMPMYGKLDRMIFTELGIPLTNEAADAIHYLPLGDSAKYIASHFDVPFTAEQVEKRLTDTVIREYEAVKIKDGVLPFLKEARAAGVRMCIATATERGVSLPVAARLGLFDYMERLVCCGDVGATKEKPDVFLEAARLLDASPKTAAVFEDGLPGVQSAASAGFTVVGVYDSTATPKDTSIIRARSDLYVRSLTEAGALLERRQEKNTTFGGSNA